MLERYVDQVRLLLSVLPDIAGEKVFALKGGTAINLFYKDMPRLSVDIDLTYLPVDDRETLLKDINETLDRIMAAIINRRPRRQRLTGNIAAFLLSVHDAKPDFHLVGLPEAADLPAVRWKLINLGKLKENNRAKHAAQRGALEELF